MAKGSGKGKASRNRALEVLENMKDGDTVVIPQDENGEVIGESLADILAAQAAPVVPEAPVEEAPVDVVESVVSEGQEAAPADPPAPAGTSVEDIMAELGLSVVAGPVPEIQLPARQDAAPAPAKGESKGKASKTPKAPKEKAEKSSKAPVVRIPIDAPIPAVEFRGYEIGVYGNLLERLEEPDDTGYHHTELKLERFNATAHESFRNKNGRMVLLYPQGGGVYLVATELPDGTKEPVIEVTNRGRGCLRCRQMATVFQMAYQEKKDEVMITPQEYAELVSKVNRIESALAPVSSIPEAPAEDEKKEEIPV